jgi:hypothetical protein
MQRDLESSSGLQRYQRLADIANAEGFFFILFVCLLFIIYLLTYLFTYFIYFFISLFFILGDLMSIQPPQYPINFETEETQIEIAPPPLVFRTKHDDEEDEEDEESRKFDIFVLCLFIYVFNYLFIYLFIHSFIHLFIYLCLKQKRKITKRWSRRSGKDA